MDISSLAHDDTFLAGLESTEIDNTANNYVDVLVDVKGITGGATTPAVGDRILLYVWGSDVSLGTTPIGVLDGTASAETLAHAQARNALRLAGSAEVTVATASLVWYIQPFSVASLFGGKMPKFWGMFLTHNLGGTLAASQSGLFRYTGIKYTST
jgi:hypothetical protein